VKKSKYTIRLLRAAEEDFNDIISYVAAENMAAAETTAIKIERSLARLSDHPYLGRIPEEEDLIRLGYRFLVVENYLIFYTLEDRTIWVHRILHGAHNYITLGVDSYA
jgi:toxin ParE1/3/4